MYFYANVYKMELEKRLSAIAALGTAFNNIPEDEFDSLCMRAQNENNWFTRENIKSTFQAWANELTDKKISQWTHKNKLNPSSPKRIGLILAGNLPLVGLHDVLTVLLSGHIACLKYSSQDKALMSWVIRELTRIEPDFGTQIEIREQMKEIDAVIATGSDNSARYFNYYFSKMPHIIRQNRVSAAIIKGDETKEELSKLGTDIFQYFGLGCRNVAKLFVPKEYDFIPFIESQLSFESVLQHHKFQNNYDYNKSIYLVNSEPHLDSGFFLLREAEEMVSPISVLFYETYTSEAELALRLSAVSEKVQCTVSNKAWYSGSRDFGQAQCPALWDYADGVDTLEWLDTLK